MNKRMCLRVQSDKMVVRGAGKKLVLAVIEFALMLVIVLLLLTNLFQPTRHFLPPSIRNFKLVRELRPKKPPKRKQKKKSTNLCEQLQVDQHCIDTTLNYSRTTYTLIHRLAYRNKRTHVCALLIASQVTSHLQIDISDVQEMCCYELGRTYLKLSNAVCIHISPVDPDFDL